MSSRDHHQPCACGAELADECPRCARTNPLGSMRIRADDEALYRHARGQDRTESDERAEMAPEDSDAATRAMRAEVERTKRGARELGRILDRTLRDALDASGRHDAIDDDGDGDWAVVWETLAELRPRAESAEAELRALREGVEALADEKCTDPENHTTCVSACFRALLAPSPAATTGEAEGGCDGSSRCTVANHHHGCFRDFGKCDDPTDHPDFESPRATAILTFEAVGPAPMSAPVSSGEAGAGETDTLIPDPSAEEAAWQQSAISARARGDFAAERSFLDRLALAERRPAPVVAPSAEGSE